MMYRMLDKDDDWSFGQGLQSYCKDDQAIETAMLVSVRTIQGENWCDRSIGLPWISLMAQKELKDIDLYMIRDYILACRGVAGVENLDLERKENRQIVLKYNLQTVYNFNIEGSTQIEVF